MKWVPDEKKWRTYFIFLSLFQLDDAAQIKNTDIAKELSLPPVKLHCSSEYICYILYVRTSKQHLHQMGMNWHWVVKLFFESVWMSSDDPFFFLSEWFHLSVFVQRVNN